VVTSPKKTLKVTEVVADQQYTLGMNVRDRSGVNWWINYTKGSEDYVKYSFKFSERETGISGFLVERKDNVVKKIELKQDEDLNDIIPVPVPMGGDWMDIILEFVGDTSSVGLFTTEARYAEEHQ